MSLSLGPQKHSVPSTTGPLTDCSPPKWGDLAFGEQALVTLMSNQASSMVGTPHPRQENVPEPYNRNLNHSLWSTQNCLGRGQTSKAGAMLTGSQDSSKKQTNKKRIS